MTTEKEDPPMESLDLFTRIERELTIRRNNAKSNAALHPDKHSQISAAARVQTYEMAIECVRMHKPKQTFVIVCTEPSEASEHIVSVLIEGHAFSMPYRTAKKLAHALELTWEFASAMEAPSVADANRKGTN